MFTIRKGVFETNSSTTHSIILCTIEEYEKWMDNDLFLTRVEGGVELLTREEVRRRIPELRRMKIPTTIEELHEFNEWAMYCGYYCFEFVNDGYLDDAEAIYVLPSGEQMIARSLEYES